MQKNNCFLVKVKLCKVLKSFIAYDCVKIGVFKIKEINYKKKWRG